MDTQVYTYYIPNTYGSYIYIEREREICLYMSLSLYIYIYIGNKGKGGGLAEYLSCHWRPRSC